MEQPNIEILRNDEVTKTTGQRDNGASKIEILRNDGVTKTTGQRDDGETRTATLRDDGATKTVAQWDDGETRTATQWIGSPRETRSWRRSWHYKKTMEQPNIEILKNDGETRTATLRDDGATKTVAQWDDGETRTATQWIGSPRETRSWRRSWHYKKTMEQPNIEILKNDGETRTEA